MHLSWDTVQHASGAWRHYMSLGLWLEEMQRWYHRFGPKLFCSAFLIILKPNCPTVKLIVHFPDFVSNVGY